MDLVIKAPINISILGYRDGKNYSLRSVDDSFKITQDHLQRLTECCNQDLIYDFLFNDKFEGRSYNTNDAQHFFDWALQGWQSLKYYPFVVLDDQQNIVGAIDIKSNLLSENEVGYWADQNVPGFMTNALYALKELAFSNGCQKLFAYTRLSNHRSQNLLIRSNFTNIGRVVHSKRAYLRFELATDVSK